MSEDNPKLDPSTPGNGPAPAQVGEFESTQAFADDPKAPTEKTPDEEYDAAYEAELEAAGEGQAGPAQRIYEAMTDDELKAVFDKARMVDELNERLQKTHRDAFGRIGGLEQTIREMKETAKAQPQAAQLSREQFKHLSDYLGEDDDGLLEALVGDLSALQLGIPLAPNLDVESRFAEEQARIQAMQQEHEHKLVAMQRDLETKLLGFQHPDWQDYNTDPAKAQAFIDWQMTLTEQDRHKIAEASQNWDGRTLANALTKYKEYAAKKAEHEQQKQARLAGNTPPTRGNGYDRPPPGYDNDYEAGFQQGLNS